MTRLSMFTDPISDWIHILYLNTKQLVWYATSNGNQSIF